MADITFQNDVAALRRMNERFTPDPANIIDAARNRKPARLPLYEHIIDMGVMEKILGEPIRALRSTGGKRGLMDYYRKYSGAFRFMGYDYAVLEVCLGGAMPGSGALIGERDGVISDRASFRAYPWKDIPRVYKDSAYPEFDAFTQTLPQNMTAIGGVGNGLFECAEDLIGFEQLCYMNSDDPNLYSDVFKQLAETQLIIWRDFLSEFGGRYGVLRFGDDLGYKTNTMLSARDIEEHIIPGYAAIIGLVHATGKPFLLHSCGSIFGVMDALISKARIDAKHSNEDAIAPISRWLDTYNDRIGIFGGVDVDALCRGGDALDTLVRDIYRVGRAANGFAFGTGNSIAPYVPPENYARMIRVFRELRGETGF
ncbi:MAG: hypothetical protein LBS11_12510 [Oscillospiraceae bacterium]|jgi:uroporphyrinogen decarboxylase|nr:hypothetical protein [Oscillospiraceae bacterium]